MKPLYYELPKGVELPIVKVCACGEKYTHLPTPGKVTSVGVWFDCAKCGSNNLLLCELSSTPAQKFKAPPKKDASKSFD